MLLSLSIPPFGVPASFCQISHADRCEFESLLSKSALRVFPQNEEEKVSLRNHEFVLY